MSGRPCNPGSDLRQLWQALLGNTPFPRCGVYERQGSPPANGDTPDAEPARKRDDAAAVQRKR